MDPYERLTAINESLMGRIKRYLTTPREVRQFERAVADLEKKYPNLPENQPRRKGVENIQTSLMKPLRKKLGESTEAERIDQAGVKGKKALKDAGLKFKFRQSIGSMNREDNHFIVSPEDVEAARKALKGVSNAQVKTK